MQGVKISELKEGHIYRCLLSGKNVLYYTGLSFIPRGEAIKYQRIRVFTEQGYQETNPIDYQLAEIKEAN